MAFNFAYLPKICPCTCFADSEDYASLTVTCENTDVSLFLRNPYREIVEVKISKTFQKGFKL